jgi:hypothetical protein
VRLRALREAKRQPRDGDARVERRRLTRRRRRRPRRPRAPLERLSAAAIAIDHKRVSLRLVVHHPEGPPRGAQTHRVQDDGPRANRRAEVRLGHAARRRVRARGTRQRRRRRRLRFRAGEQRVEVQNAARRRDDRRRDALARTLGDGERGGGAARGERAVENSPRDRRVLGVSLSREKRSVEVASGFASGFVRRVVRRGVPIFAVRGKKKVVVVRGGVSWNVRRLQERGVTNGVSSVPRSPPRRASRARRRRRAAAPPR